jgi:hypothetical protein
MDFNTYHAAVVYRTRSFASAAQGFKRKQVKQKDLNGAKARRITAAAALVIADRGEEWCRRNPQAFEASVLSHLGTIANIAITLFGIFSGGGIWIALAKILIPAVITFLVDRAMTPPGVFGGVLVDDFESLYDEASQIVKGD